jgi:hypothetical protein
MDYPVYLLRLNDKWRVVFPEGKADIGHTDFWEKTVSRTVADFYKIPRALLVNLPYSQRRARIVGDALYYGGRPDPDLLAAICTATGNRKLVFCFDEHERRLKEDVLTFRKLVRRFAINAPNPPQRRPGQNQ